jgi:hypothetical protein
MSMNEPFQSARPRRGWPLGLAVVSVAVAAFFTVVALGQSRPGQEDPVRPT